MPKKHKPRFGSLQFWPRKRAVRVLPSVNYKAIEKKKKGILGAICYKAGMLTAIVKDITPDSMTLNKQIFLPVTIMECPPMKVFGIRFYKENKVTRDVLASVDKELKRKIKIPKKSAKLEEKIPKEYDNINLIVYSLVKRTGIKKTPDIAEIGLGGSLQESLEKAKNLFGKEISTTEIFSAGQLVDIHAVTKGKGTQGPVKRFGISLRQAKSEKGVRKAGSLGPWTPKRVSFRAPLAGQLGFFTRCHYNNKILEIADIKKKDINPTGGFLHYGKIKTFYAIVKGSIQGSAKRPLLLSFASRETKKTAKKKFELIKLE